MLVGHAYIYSITIMKNQTLLNCIYFIFITMSTIGFGDISFDINYIQKGTLEAVYYALDPVLFYMGFALLSSVINSAVNMETNGDNKIKDMPKNEDEDFNVNKT